MATKRTEQAATTSAADGSQSTLRILSFVTPEDYIDLAVSAQIYKIRTGQPYKTDILPRDVRDTFLRLNLDSGLAEVRSE